jgi:hypothetical protein
VYEATFPIHEYDGNTASASFASFASVAFTSSHAYLADLSGYSLVDSTCSVNLTSFRSDFTDFWSRSRLSTIGGVGVTVKGSGIVRAHIFIVSGQTLFRLVHALCTLDLTSRSAHHIGRLLSVSWMHKHSGCEFLFPTDFDSGIDRSSESVSKWNGFLQRREEY